MPALEEYEWVYVLSAFAMVGATIGIGANDGANPWATPVGSGALSLRWAYALAIVCEIAGAVTGGSPVSETIRKGIANSECFEGGENDAALLMYGNYCVLLIVGIWLILASRYEMPVSTTHTAVCGMVGMAWFAKGSECVVWYENGTPGEWEIPGGMTGIFLSWIFAPVLSGLLSALIHVTNRRFILRSANPFERAVRFYPLLVLFAATAGSFLMLSKGISKRLCPKGEEDWLCSGGGTRGEVAFGLALAVGATAAIGGIPLFRKVGEWAKADLARKQQEQATREPPPAVSPVAETALRTGDDVSTDSFDHGDGRLAVRTNSYRVATGTDPIPIDADADLVITLVTPDTPSAPAGDSTPSTTSGRE